MKIINEDLLLRKADLTDTDILYQLKNNEVPAALLGGFSNGYSKEDISNWIKFHNNASNECLYLIQERKTGKVIGHVGLYNIDYRIRKAEYAILIADENSQGKGYGKAITMYMIDYGFYNLNLNRIELSLLGNNVIARELYLKCGFEQEGLLKQAQYKNGFYIDVILMAIFRE